MNGLRRHRGAWPLALVLAYALCATGWAVLRTPLRPGEAALLLAARGGSAAPCAPAGGDALGLAACALPGASGAVPRLAAVGDRLGGLAGARAILALSAPALLLLAVRAGSSPRWGRRGLLAGATFAALGAPLQLLAPVHPRALAALLLGCAAVLAEPPAREDGGGWPWARPARLALAGAALALSATATPVAAPFALPLAAALARGHGRRGAAALAAGLAAVVVASASLAGAWGGLAGALRAAPPGGWDAAAGRVAALGDGLAMPVLLASFALFHRDGGARAAAALAVAAPAALVPVLGASLDDTRTAQLLAFVVLTPAAAVGVARMAELFAAGNPSPRARPLYLAAILAVAGVHGVHVVRGLRRDGPDLAPAVAFLRSAGSGAQTLLVESDFGGPERVYRYLEAAARVVPLARASGPERRAALRAATPEWVVLDAYHADRSFDVAEREYLAQGFAVAARWDVAVGAGARRLEVLRRDGP